MLEVSYWEEVEFYSSYIQGKDSEVRHKDSKFILTNPMNGKIYKEISVPKEDVRYHRDQVLEKSIAYFKYNEDCNCITDLGVWPYLVENGVTFLQRESLIDDTTDYSTQGKPSFKRILSTHRSDGRLNFKERHFFVWDTEKNTFAKWIPTGKSEWMTECNDIQWTEKHFRCVLAKDGILLLDENQMVLDSIAKGDYHLEESAKYSLRFYGNYIGVGHEIYKMEDNGKISDNPLFEIHLKQGAFIYTSTGDTISYTEENL
ncbi:MAG: hypothetical protein HUJ74_02770 [Lachnospiraceae bacterium]|nr:hypothetical protein [Lachnospiraceae bacterium]